MDFNCHASLKESAQTLNRACLCHTLSRKELELRLSQEAHIKSIFLSHPHLFSNTSVFISAEELTQLLTTINNIETVLSSTAFRQRVLTAELQQKIGTGQGVFMGYDFHLSEQGPQLIEINTNAGGAFLNSLLLSAQTECCAIADSFLPLTSDAIEKDFLNMFITEWQTFSHSSLTTIAIVDDQPEQQYLYPEFKLAQALFQRAGIQTVIGDVRDLEIRAQKATLHGTTIDLIYNRVTDFSLNQLEHSVLAEIFYRDLALVTPNPLHHALYANKSNLFLLSQATELDALGVAQSLKENLLRHIPETLKVSAQNADDLWRERKNYFFKPLSGFGGKATYRGDKLTQKVWQNILQADYVAQRTVPPSTRFLRLNSEPEPDIADLKFDVRAYTYGGNLLMLAARLYQGQTTNFRTEGGGFAPVFVTSRQ